MTDNINDDKSEKFKIEILPGGEIKVTRGDVVFTIPNNNPKNNKKIIS